MGPITNVTKTNIFAMTSPLTLCAMVIYSPALATVSVGCSLAVNNPFSCKKDVMMGASERDSRTNLTIQSVQVSGRSCLIRVAIIPHLFDMMDQIISMDIMQYLP